MTAASLNNTQGILALAALAVAMLALIGCAVLTRTVAPLAWRPEARARRGGAAGRDRAQRLFAGGLRSTPGVRGRCCRALGQAPGRSRVGLTGAVSHHALVRYDAYNELSGQQSVSIALLDDRHSGVVLTCIHHRDQARVYAKQVLEGLGELELSPEEAEAVRVALVDKPGVAVVQHRRRGGGWRRRCHRQLARRPRAGYLGPEGTFSEEALLGSVLSVGRTGGRARDDPRRCDGSTGGFGGVGARADRELDRGLGDGDARHPGRQAGDVEIVGEGVLPVRHYLIAASRSSSSRSRLSSPIPTFPASARAFCMSVSRSARVTGGKLDRGGSATGERALTRRLVVGRDRNTAGGRAVWVRGDRRGDPGSRGQRDALRLACAEQTPARGLPLRAPTGRAQDIARVLGCGRRPRRLAGAVLGRVARREINLTKIESRPMRERLGTTCSLSISKDRCRRGSFREALAGLRACANRCACLAPIRQLELFSALPRWAATRVAISRS